MIDKLLLPEVQKFIKDHQFDDPFLLSLHAKKSKTFPYKEAIEQIQSLQKAKTKHPVWAEKENIIWPSPVSIEQSSSEVTAKYKTKLLQGDSMIDLTGGMGVDSCFFAGKFKRIDFVESDKHLCELAKHNFSVLGKNNINVHNDKAEDFIDAYSCKVDAIYIDPSRRSAGKRVIKIQDYSPDLCGIIPKCKVISDQILVKLSPMVDLGLLIQNFKPTNIYVAAIKNEVKEVLCLIRHETLNPRIHAVDLDLNSGIISEFKFIYQNEARAKSEFSLPQKYLYEPNAAILKAGAFKLIGKHYGLKKLHQHTHLYTSDELVENFPGRIFMIKNQIKGDKKEMAILFPGRKANVITRNYPLSASQLKKKLGLQDGGDSFLLGTTQLSGQKVLFLCVRI